MLEIRLSGTVDAICDGQPVAVRGRRLRALLVLLALDAGQKVSVDALTRGVWDDDPPEHVRGSLQTYVGRLRRVLGEDVIETEASGYRLRVPRHAVDLLAFSDEIETAAEATVETEREILGNVLRRWDGDPFGEDPSLWIARHEAPLWAERRLNAFERWVDLSFDAGDDAACVVELNRQVARHPLRETLWVRLLRTLARSGRSAEALVRYESLRRQLAEELGVDPSPELRSAYRRLLATSDNSVEPAELHVPRVPRQLPPRIAGFVGREDRLARLDGLLAESQAKGGSHVIALHGPAGSGKTTLAIHWAHRIKELFPDGQVFLNLQGYGPGEALDVSEALNTLLHGVGVHGSRIPAEVEARSDLLRSELDGRRVLVLLDNARDSDQVRPILPGSDGLVVVTSRKQLRSMATREGARRVAVDRMSTDEAVQLLANRIDDRPDVSELHELAELCDHLPVALAVAAERADRDPARVVGEVIAPLRNRRRRLDTLSGGDDPLTSVRAVLDWSYQALDEATARLFRHIGLYEAPTISTDAASALAGIERSHAARLLDRLANYHLLKADGDGWYGSHDLIREYAAELMQTVDTDAERMAAVRRLRSWLVHTANNARMMLSRPHVPGRLPDLEAEVTPSTFDATSDALSWFTAHIGYLRAVALTASAEGDPVGRALAPTLYSYLILTGAHGQTMIDLYNAAEASGRSAGDVLAQAQCANCLGGVYENLARFREALACSQRAASLYEEAGHVPGRLLQAANSALHLTNLGRNAEAVVAYEQIIEEARRHELQGQLALALRNASKAHLEEGRPDMALQAASESVDLHRRTQQRAHDLAIVLKILGDAQVASRLDDLAVESYGEALALFDSLDGSIFEVETLQSLGVLQQRRGHDREARACWERGLRVLDRLGATDTYFVNRGDLVGLVNGLETESGSDPIR